MNKKDNSSVQESSGNIFSDIGMQDPDQEQLKAGLTLQVYRLIRNRKLTQTETSEILGINQSHVSALMRNRSGNFSTKRLKDFLTILGQGVEMNARPASKRKKQGGAPVHVQG